MSAAFSSSPGLARASAGPSGSLFVQTPHPTRTKRPPSATLVNNGTAFAWFVFVTVSSGLWGATGVWGVLWACCFWG
ncbi:hypothetical protein CHLRE_03g153076v5 [Chlamydomonas reinhardtii]|uniref:Uncharacterized protein n=1 Tax=Chlamydomonas reinhardtii TaxID=3055 RepID=A0A2K3DVV2_CHLRE|nr:uncharacterized protein CHLRE_03g153076v5 [Chlamydomonas reinhardtii]PNW84652.1 hypothetical protein CHLRE_03g153076v5 [Chlamydomonas reinhardtii]